MDTSMALKVSLTIFLLLFVHKSVSSIESQYIGCYNDESPAHAMSIRNDDNGNTINKCLQYCQQNKYTFTGVEEGNQCHCGEEFTRYGKADEDQCNSACSGADTQTCGGSSKLSIYTTCPMGFYGSDCGVPCPLNCNRICHLMTGRCCEESQAPDEPFCSFYNTEDCGILIGDPRSVVGDMAVKAGPSMNLFSTMTFSQNAAIKKIIYYTRKEGIEYLSFWRKTENWKYLMAGTVKLQPTKAGVHTKDLSLEERLYVQTGDAAGLYYLNNEEDMIPYQSSSTSDILAVHIHDVIYAGRASSSWIPGEVRSFSAPDGQRRTPALKIEYDCIQECSPGTFGPNCQKDCGVCKDGIQCHNVEGTCPDGCQSGYRGDWCEPCPEYFYGDECKEPCGHCRDNVTCVNVNGKCDNGCHLGYKEDLCKTECKPGWYGYDCEGKCSQHCFNETCDRQSLYGSCDSCKPGFEGHNCTSKCSNKTYGPECTQKCGSCRGGETCNNVNGTCENGCEPGYEMDKCAERCRNYTYGEDCSFHCSRHCFNNEACNHVNGSCDRCEAGYKGVQCNETCMPYFYGQDCEQKCGFCKNNSACHHESGHCDVGCDPGYVGDTCHMPLAEESTTESLPEKSNGAIIGGVVAAVVVAAIVIVVVYLLWRRKKIGKGKRTEGEGAQFSNFEPIPAIATSVEKKLSLKGNDGSTESETGGIKTQASMKPKVPVKPKVSEPPNEQLYMNVQRNETLIAIGDIGKYVKHKESEEEPFKEEFLMIPKDKNGDWTYCGQPNLKVKNRYKNIMPYDVNRVVLPVENGEPLSDYINASFIKDFLGKHVYIASHGPYGVTVEDFWRMLWEYEVETIVMLTNLVEQMKIKCDQYWPSNGFLNHGGLTLSLEEEQIYDDYVLRHIKARKGERERTIRQYHYLKWPDKGVPNDTTGILTLREIVKNYREARDKPIVIHCSAGVGRTGTFIAIDVLLDQAEHKREVDVHECVKELRRQRVNMVQTLDQYKYVYTSIWEATTVGVTALKYVGFTHALSTLCSKTGKGKSDLEKQFQFLEEFTEAFQKEPSDLAELSQNKDKNRDMDVLPDDNNRLIIPSDPNVYINAVHVKGRNDKIDFIATQIPLPNSKEDFYRLLLELKPSTLVCLEILEDEQMWFPKPSANEQIGEYCVTNREQVVEGDISQYDLEIQKEDINESEYANVQTTDKLDVRLFSTSWEKSESGMESLKSLCTKVSKWVSGQNDKTTLVMCRNGADKTGIFIAFYKILAFAAQSKEISIMQVVKSIKKTRPQFISSMDDYLFLHKALEFHLNESNIYAN